MSRYTSLVVSEKGIATITLLGSSDSKTEWGTPLREHRLNPGMVSSLMSDLKRCESRMDVFCVVVVNQGPFWSNGLDLAWVDANDEKSNKAFVLQVNKLMEKVLTFPIPTVGAMNGHWCAAGGMLGLCFDYRVMNEDRGYFFIPAVDLGIVYSAFQIELMKSKLPMYMHREIICFNAKRWTAKELQQNHVVDDAAPKGQVLKWALKLATTLLTKGKGPARKALKPIKERVYAQVLATLVQEEGGSMQFGGRKSGANYAAPPSRL